MGRKKFRLSTHRKNEECKRQKKEVDWQTDKDLSLVVSIPRWLVTVRVSALTVSLPLSLYWDGHVTSVNSLQTHLKSLSLPESWILASSHPLVLSKLHVLPEASQAPIKSTINQHRCRTQVVAVCPEHACEPHTLYFAEWGSNYPV